MRRFFVPKWILIFAVLVTAPVIRAQCSNSPVDAKELTQSLSCGSRTWSLKYSYAGQIYTVVYAYSPAGTCGGNRYGCDCGYQGYWEDAGDMQSMTRILTDEDGNPGYDIFWNSTEHNSPHIEACNPNAGCCPNNGQEVKGSDFSFMVGEVFVPCY
jgi:hypothetical protein